MSNVYTLGKLPKPKSKENTTFGIFLQGPQGECDASPKSKLKKHKVAEHGTCDEKRIRADAVFVIKSHFRIVK